MISTVTTTVSTIVSSSAAGLVAALVGAGVVTLIASLMTKELVTEGSFRFRLFGRNLDIIILPLLFAFSVIVFMNVNEILS